MSYNISLTHSGTTEVIQLDKKHYILGGTYQVGGCWDASLNITWNYGSIYYRIFGKEGIRVIYGLTGAESIPVLRKAIIQLKDDVDKDYWKATDGNAKMALMSLLSFAQKYPKGEWSGN